MSLYDFQVHSLKAVLSEPSEALRSWEALISKVGFDDLPNVTNRFLPRIYLRLRGLNGVPEFNRIRGSYKLNWARNSRLLANTSPLFVALNREEIPYVVIKGVAVALKTNSLGARVCGDVDFVVHSRFLPRVKLILAEQGWRLRDPDSPLGIRGVGGYVNQFGLFVDLHSHDQFPPHLHVPIHDRIHVSWRDLEIAIPSQQSLMKYALRHGASGAAESDLAQAIVDFVDLCQDVPSPVAHDALFAMRSSLAGSDFLPLLAETGVMPEEVFRAAIGSGPRKGVPIAGSPLMVLLRKALIAPRLIWRRRLTRDQLRRVLIATLSQPRVIPYALWVAFGQFRPVERALMKLGVRIARPENLFTKGGLLPERDFRRVVPNPFPNANLVSITLEAEQNIENPGDRERTLVINGKALGFFPVEGNLVARYLLESPGEILDISFSANHRLPVFQIAAINVIVSEIGIDYSGNQEGHL